ncbi:MAG: hypothetical protein DWQ01_11340 [Planctomycetota bacterium]|nr:MAG: hypothetical protein DWQ01_11340 [Planctomycetota bacterium]
MSLWVGSVVFAGDNLGKTDRGDDPLVGSLPCMVDPQLMDKFHDAFGLPGLPSEDILDQRPTLGLTGLPGLSGLSGLEGIPKGQVDWFEDWNVVGLVQEGQAYLDRGAALTGDITLWQWLPDGYLGGDLTIQGTMGKSHFPILANAQPLNLADLAALPEGSQSLFTFKPGPGNGALGSLAVEVMVTSSSVLVTFLP